MSSLPRPTRLSVNDVVCDERQSIDMRLCHRIILGGPLAPVRGSMDQGMYGWSIGNGTDGTVCCDGCGISSDDGMVMVLDGGRGCALLEVIALSEIDGI